MKVGIVVVALACFLLVPIYAYASSVCIIDDDCPGHNESRFCGSPICSSGVCVQSPNPCSQVCSETLQRCVECETASNCPLEGQICSVNNTCRWCLRNNDCPQGTWCQGGQLLCVSERCVIPSESRWPCASSESCSEEYHNCNRCDSDSDCGDTSYDWCTNRVYCNVSLHQCVHEDPLPSPCRVCDSERRECLECEIDAQCRTTEWQLTQPFCIPPLVVPQCVNETCTLVTVTESSMLDYWQLPCQQDTASIAYVCNEQQKQCIEHFTAEQLPSVLDGARMIDNEVSLSVYITRLQETPISCQRNGDCKRLGWLCRTISTFDQSERICTPCHSDPQCIIDGNGYGTCNKTLGSCIDPISDDPESVTIPQVTAQVGGLGSLTLIKPGADRTILYPNIVPSLSSIQTVYPTKLDGEWEGLGDTLTFQLLVMCLLVFIAGGSIVTLTLYKRRWACFRRMPDRASKSSRKQREAKITDTKTTTIPSTTPYRLLVSSTKSTLATVFENF